VDVDKRRRLKIVRIIHSIAYTLVDVGKEPSCVCVVSEPSLFQIGESVAGESVATDKIE
jgi:hypothetical protein